MFGYELWWNEPRWKDINMERKCHDSNTWKSIVRRYEDEKDPKTKIECWDYQFATHNARKAFSGRHVLQSLSSRASHMDWESLADRAHLSYKAMAKYYTHKEVLEHHFHTPSPEQWREECLGSSLPLRKMLMDLFNVVFEDPTSLHGMHDSGVPLVVLGSRVVFDLSVLSFGLAWRKKTGVSQ